MKYKITVQIYCQEQVAKRIVNIRLVQYLFIDRISEKYILYKTGVTVQCFRSCLLNSYKQVIN